MRVASDDRHPPVAVGQSINEAVSMTSVGRALTKTLLLSLGFWGAAMLALGIVITMFGDCPTDPRPNGRAKCFAEQQAISRGGLLLTALGNIPFAIWAYRASRKGS